MKQGRMTSRQLRQKLERRQKYISRVAPFLIFNLLLFVVLLGVSYVSDNLQMMIISVFILVITSAVLLKYQMTGIALKLSQGDGNVVDLMDEHLKGSCSIEQDAKSGDQVE